MVRLAKWEVCILEKRLEIFFRTLLGMETDCVEIWRFPHSEFPASRGEIALGFLDPLTD
jgi:hypothetical protein